MKKIFIFLSALIPFGLSGQAIVNGNFESWNKIDFDEPNGWFTSNTETVRRDGIITATKSTDSHNGSAIKLETKASGTDYNGAYVINSQGDPMEGEGGFPYAAQPTHITGYYKYDLKGNDTAIMLVIFKKNGEIINADFFKIRGTGTQSTYTAFSFPLTLSTMPDSVIIGAASSNLIEEVGIAAGSTLYLDDLAFTGSGAMPEIPNGDFEDWTKASYETLNDWESYGEEGISKNTSAYKGSFSVALQTLNFGGMDIGASTITNAEITQTGPNAGRPYTLQADTLIGFYKYTANVTDSALVQITFSKNGNNIDYYSKLLPAAAQFTMFEIPFNLQQSPDSVRIEITSSKWPYSIASVGSTLIIDEIQFKSQPLHTSIKKVAVQNGANAYPNPAKNTLTILPANTINGSGTLTIFNALGEIVITRHYENISNRKGINVDVSALKNGMYFYKITVKETELSGKFIKN